MKSRRQLSREEHELWGHVTRGVKKLRAPPRKPALDPAATVAPEKVLTGNGSDTPARKSKSAPAPPAASPPVPKTAHKPAQKPLVPLEPKARRRLSRGQSDVAGRIDLHGMRQEEAHQALLRFILDAHANDARLVLVITGKGKTSAQESHAGHREVGVLRRLTPHWLSEPALRHIVLGYEAASTRHGGEGAIYVRIRKRGAS